MCNGNTATANLSQYSFPVTQGVFECHVCPVWLCFAVDSNPCQTNPCLHGGSCLQEGDGYSCYCPQGFSGESCEIGESLGTTKKTPTLPDLKTQRSAAADCWVTVTRGWCGEEERSICWAALQHMYRPMNWGGDLEGGGKRSVFFFFSSIFLFVSAPVMSTSGCSSLTGDKMGICKSWRSAALWWRRPNVSSQAAVCVAHVCFLHS